MRCVLTLLYFSSPGILKNKGKSSLTLVYLPLSLTYLRIYILLVYLDANFKLFKQIFLIIAEFRRSSNDILRKFSCFSTPINVLLTFGKKSLHSFYENQDTSPSRKSHKETICIFYLFVSNKIKETKRRR